MRSSCVQTVRIRGRQGHLGTYFEGASDYDYSPLIDGIRLRAYPTTVEQVAGERPTFQGLMDTGSFCTVLPPVCKGALQAQGASWSRAKRDFRLAARSAAGVWTYVVLEIDGLGEFVVRGVLLEGREQDRVTLGRDVLMKLALAMRMQQTDRALAAAWVWDCTRPG
jgi:hypothetical protein